MLNSDGPFRLNGEALVQFILISQDSLENLLYVVADFVLDVERVALVVLQRLKFDVLLRQLDQTLHILNYTEFGARTVRLDDLIAWSCRELETGQQSANGFDLTFLYVYIEVLVFWPNISRNFIMPRIFSIFADVDEQVVSWHFD